MGEKRNLRIAEVNSITKIGRHRVGPRGLYLQVSRWGTRSWIFQYWRNGRGHDLGLGSCSDIQLHEARDRLKHWRDLMHKDLSFDPASERQQQRSGGTKTFGWCAERCLEEKIKHEVSPAFFQAWESSLRSGCAAIWATPVEQISHAMIASDVLGPIWLAKPRAAVALRGRIERVFSWAKAAGHRKGDNPATWDLLKNILPKTNGQTRGHESVPWDQIPGFMSALRQRKGLTARALEFLTLTAVRTSNAIGARWDQIDMAGKLWRIPGPDMKVPENGEHVVPLGKQAVALLKALPRENEWVFPSTHHGGANHISRDEMRMVMRKLGRTETPHGMRSSFRSWAQENSIDHDASEMIMAHKVDRNKSRLAYMRADLLDQRRKILQQWADHCGG
jgi:integrase